MSKADLHTHTTASDGLHRPEDNVRMASEAGLSAIAITDHDTVAGIPEALEAGKRYGVRVVPGVEISTAAEGQDIHILGYGIDWQHPLLLERLISLRGVRDRRNVEILRKLDELGVPVTMDEALEAAARSARSDRTIGRPHIAEAMVRKGYVSDLREAFDRYLANDKPAYYQPPRIAPEEAFRWIHDAGGVAIVAHPGIYDRDALVESLLDGEADGLEAYHSDHDEAAESRYAAMAEARGKFATGGSDFHGTKNGVTFHGPIGNRTVDVRVLERMLGQ